MNFVIKSRALDGSRPIHRRTFITLLIEFGIPKVTYNGGRRMFTKWKRRDLWDIYDMVRERWKKLRRMLHPDVSRNNYRRFAVMSAIHDALLARFKQRGYSP